MARFDRYLLAQLLQLFGLSALVLILVYWVNRAVSLFDRIIADGQGLGTFLELSLLALPPLIGIVVPIAAIVAAIYVTNRLTVESELTVVQATGFSPWRLARPVAVFGLIVAALTAVLGNVLIPLAASRLAERQAAIAQTATARLLREGQFLSPTDGITVYIRDITPEGEIQDVFLSDSRDADTHVVYTAARAFIVRSEVGPQLVMVDGMAQTLRTRDGTLGVTSFQDFAYDISEMLPPPRQNRRSAREVPVWELLAGSGALAAETGMTPSALAAEGHERISDVALGFVGALLGFSALLVGGFSRFGVWRQILLAIGLVIVVKAIESVVAGAVASAPRPLAIAVPAGRDGRGDGPGAARHRGSSGPVSPPAVGRGMILQRYFAKRYLSAFLGTLGVLFAIVLFVDLIDQARRFGGAGAGFAHHRPAVGAEPATAVVPDPAAGRDRRDADAFSGARPLVRTGGDPRRRPLGAARAGRAGRGRRC